jgi:hypothetical protein
MTEDERTAAIQLMADAMMAGAKFYGPNRDGIGGDRHSLAERALDALLARFTITTRSNVEITE